MTTSILFRDKRSVHPHYKLPDITAVVETKVDPKVVEAENRLKTAENRLKTAEKDTEEGYGPEGLAILRSHISAAKGNLTKAENALKKQHQERVRTQLLAIALTFPSAFFLPENAILTDSA